MGEKVNVLYPHRKESNDLFLGSSLVCSRSDNDPRNTGHSLKTLRTHLTFQVLLQPFMGSKANESPILSDDGFTMGTH